MIYLIVAGLLGLLGAVLLAMQYRHNAIINKINADDERQRANLSGQAISNRQQLDTALQTLHDTHREETIYETHPTHRAERSDFDNDWSGDARLHNAGTSEHHATSAAASSQTGAADHQFIRTDGSQ
jgi:type II secretory pathway pseudopilin PulG